MDYSLTTGTPHSRYKPLTHDINYSSLQVLLSPASTAHSYRYCSPLQELLRTRAGDC
ncbi:hypothetical protein BAUCODRAFT_39731 [Baudoinia panamericana UAMH 10762]|uniref:Uncharacterized protein n=1 Tax=Baudoinia panamericana (strain UAMH 10762) TaxID=717646 RepID=M2M315_BAUPA|nr:uncharacterized protein BAUCODRAFT_39731 [Baudoinia panamericana UAMH 10762]EMC90926.1 hypothetical protein BAUCODRAFT_39731 [Baudoinia panamericana UAMH 10762]